LGKCNESDKENEQLKTRSYSAQKDKRSVPCVRNLPFVSIVVMFE